MALKPVGIGTSFVTTVTSAKSAAISVQSDTIRLTALTSGANVAIGTEPTADAIDFFIPAGSSETLALSPASQRVVGVTTGATTILHFPEGTGSPFDVGDYLSLIGGTQSNFNFTHKGVISVDNTSNVGGFFSTRITVDHDSSAVTATFTDKDCVARKSIKVAARTSSGTGVLYIHQVQISGQA